jgi:hypothetical protein
MIKFHSGRNEPAVVERTVAACRCRRVFDRARWACGRRVIGAGRGGARAPLYLDAVEQCAAGVRGMDVEYTARALETPLNYITGRAGDLKK